jgi:hypothetical protein
VYKLIAGLFIAVGSILVVTPAVAVPHQEQADGSDHGNSNKPAKDDPNPDKGKDCELHGNHGGINEDHCATPEVVPPVVVVDPIIETPVVETETDPVRVGVPVSVDELPAADVLATDTVPVPVPTEIGTALVLTKPEPLTQLPRTGNTLMLVGIGLGLVSLGVGLKMLSAISPF